MNCIQARRIYLHIADRIPGRAQAANFPVGALLPSERNLATRVALSRSCAGLFACGERQRRRSVAWLAAREAIA
ncbi:hypothetical protein LPN01_15840 [Sphingomonas sp. A2-49]|uniref:hypothetical protein n=1 Tax=Sphingomonas sp. A2-49 TaxID=1391375 RepID=UPI0021D24ACD|nr:hypothetical protein [Sphingomonas sp. A2-49]MCU6455551.1 hypothetical protein [Sphingomonas sp. A2-49]